MPANERVLQDGFAFVALATDNVTSFVVNVCGHDSIGAPLARNMTPVSDDYLDAHGLDNLVVPIHVGEPRKLTTAAAAVPAPAPVTAAATTATATDARRRSKGKSDDRYDYCVDVVVHTGLVRRCTSPHRLREHMLSKLTVLAVEWVRQECGVVLQPSTCTLLGCPLYYRDRASTSTAAAASLPSLAELTTLASQLLASQTRDGGATDGNNRNNGGATNDDDDDASAASQHRSRLFDMRSHAPQGEASSSATTTTTARRRPLVCELPAQSGIRRGFLYDSKASLYGPGGSSEGNGKPYDGLAHLPPSLRARCKIIDTRTMAAAPPPQQQQQQTTQQQQQTPPPQQQTPLPPKQQQQQTPPPQQQEQQQTTSANTSWRCTSLEVSDEAVVAQFVPPPSQQQQQRVYSMADVDLVISERHIALDGVRTALPVCVDVDAARARFVKSRQLLTVTCPRQHTARASDE